MSLKEPRFGEVFEYGEGGGKIMYIVPANSQFRDDWTGITIEPAGTMLATRGEIAQRVPLEVGPFAHWRSLDDTDGR